MRKTQLKCTRDHLPKLMDFCGCRTAAEIGVDHGYYSAMLLRDCRTLELLWSVDPFMGKQEPIMRDAQILLMQFGNRSRLLRETSAEAAARADAENMRFDCVYIDGGHRRQSVEEDLSLWHPLVSRGGILAGHDYIKANGCGVIEAVDSFAAKHNLQLLLTAEPWSTWILLIP